jgi:hypothetical protein
MRNVRLLTVAGVLALAATSMAGPTLAQPGPLPATDDLLLTDARVTYLDDLDLLVFEQQVAGVAGGTIPGSRGQLHEAPVLGYVFPTTLDSTDVGFGEVDGVVALAITSHPDFDDTPLWDESGDRDYANDGVVFHSHWVVLGPDDRVPGGLSVVEFVAADEVVVLPPTNPGMPMYMDSPGFSVLTRGDTLKVLVPASRLNGQTDFGFDAVTAYMEVNTEDETRPLLGVYEVYSVLSGDLSLPFEVQH